jgi:predicted MFS family arabinose efflux permease
MPESKGPRTKPDPLGAILSVIGMTALVWWIIELPKGAGHPGTMAALVVAITALAAFAMWEIRTAEPMVPLGLFKHRNFAGGSFSLTLVQIGNGGLLLVLTQYLQFVLGYSPTEAGLAFIPMAVALLAFNTLGATLGQKIGNRAMTVTGLAVVAAAFGILTTVNTGSGFAIPALGLFVLGAGAGLAGPAAVSALMGEIPPEKAGVGSALNDTIQQMGAALGVAILGSVLSSRYADAMPDDAPAAARHSIAAALGDANLAGSARHAFADAMSTTFVAGTCGVLAAAALAFAVMRDRTTDGTPLTEAREPVHS